MVDGSEIRVRDTVEWTVKVIDSDVEIDDGKLYVQSRAMWFEQSVLNSQKWTIIANEEDLITLRDNGEPFEVLRPTEGYNEIYRSEGNI